MTEALTYNGRLPGVLVQIPPPAPGPAPLRLDVTGFVGFAERGPLDLPVRVEDAAQYRAIFGGDLAVAREGGRPVYANLPQAVQAFFDNGGRRCYVVRVAGADAAANTFHLPGLFTWTQVDGFVPVTRPAAWVGAWSDDVQAGTQLRSTPQRIRAAADAFRLLPSDPLAALEGIELDLEIPTPDALRDGDLLRLYLGTRWLVIQAAVTQTAALPATLRQIPVTVAADTARMILFERIDTAPTDLPATMERMDGRAWADLGAAPLTPPPDTDPGFALALPVDAAVAAGDVLRLTYTGAETRVFYLPVEEVARRFDDQTPAQPYLRVRGDQGLAVLPITRDALAGAVTQADRLTFDLHLREGESTQEIWRGLGFGMEEGESWLDALAQLADPDVLSTSAEALGARSLLLGAGEPFADGTFFLPLGMSELDPTYLGPVAAESEDGLDAFDPEDLFLDPNFGGVRLGRIMGTLDDLLYFQRPRVRPRRMHSLLPVDEVALIALPDAVHRPWGPPEPPTEEVPPEPEPEPEEPDRGCFENCDEEEPPAPEPVAPPAPVIEIAQLPVLDPPLDYDAGPLLAVQGALIELCAARADAVAVLSLPRHFERREALGWQRALAGRFLGFSEDPLSYAVAYHGWVRVRETTTPSLAPLRDVPPDGAACGLIAARELARGPWIAPANVPLQGVVALRPDWIEADQIALFDGQLNVLAHKPGRFLPLSAHTLAANRLLLQISVRRLLIYLRKFLLREGQRWVFESNNARLRQLVQTTLERALGRIVDLGGLAAFQVVTGAEVNTANDYDSGRFIVAVKIAPTTPIEFITVVLLRSGESLLEVIER